MQFREVIGQREIKERLIESFKQGRVPHAQLFSGIEGNGKMALALAYAQYINCANRCENDSCGVCPSCVKYSKLEHPDLHFSFPVVKKGSSDTFSDDYIKEWREFLHQSPYISINNWVNELGAENKQPQIYEAESKRILQKLSKKAYESEYKVLIVYSPERMNVTCANKLLKLIEEPEPKTIIIFVSDTPEQIITTILSRCQNVVIPPIKEEDLAEVLVNLRALDDRSAVELARMSSGSYLRAQELLVQSESDQFNFEQFKSLMRLAFQKNVIGLKEWSDVMSKIGRERQKQFFVYTQRLIRESFIANFKNKDLNYLSAIEDEFVSKFAPYANERNITAMLMQMENAEFHIERNVNAKMVFFDVALKFTQLILRK